MMDLPLMFEPAEKSVEAYNHLTQAYSHSWRMVLLGTLCFALTQLIDVSIFHYLHNKTGEKLLWLRNNVSSITSGFFANMFFWYFAFGHILDNWFASAMAGFTLTTLVNICDTPFMYMAKLIRPLDLSDKLVTFERNAASSGENIEQKP